MRIINLSKILVLLVSLLIITGCGQNYGKMLAFNGGQLYYTSAVTVAEADKLGRYLVSSEFFDGNEKTVQINKTGNTYEFRMVIKTGLERDQEVIDLMKLWTSELSTDVFDGNPVDIHLCDDQLKTLRVVVDL